MAAETDPDLGVADVDTSLAGLWHMETEMAVPPHPGPEHSGRPEFPAG